MLSKNFHKNKREDVKYISFTHEIYFHILCIEYFFPTKKNLFFYKKDELL